MIHPTRPNPVLDYFGLTSLGALGAALLWAAPYLLLLGVALGGLAYLSQFLVPLPLTVHCGAIALAEVYFFLFLCRVRRHTAAGSGG